MSDDIPDGVKDFLRRYITSVGHLEILILLFKEPERFWTAQQVSLEQRTNTSLAQIQLEELAQKGLVTFDGSGGARFCSEAGHGDIMSKVVAFYTLRRAIVIEFIYSQPLDRIRSFADAFKIKRD